MELERKIVVVLCDIKEYSRSVGKHHHCHLRGVGI
jgi:hypothetical protein